MRGQHHPTVTSATPSISLEVPTGRWTAVVEVQDQHLVRWHAIPPKLMGACDPCSATAGYWA